jgi:hypothetical protein
LLSYDDIYLSILGKRVTESVEEGQSIPTGTSAPCKYFVYYFTVFALASTFQLKKQLNRRRRKQRRRTASRERFLCNGLRGERGSLKG